MSHVYTPPIKDAIHHLHACTHTHIPYAVSNASLNPKDQTSVHPNLFMYLLLHLSPSPQIPLPTILKPEPNRDRNTSNQTHTKRRRAPLVMITHSLPLLNPIHPPKEYRHGVEQCQDGDDGKGNRRREGDAIAEVEERGGDGAEDDGEFELEKTSV